MIEVRKLSDDVTSVVKFGFRNQVEHSVIVITINFNESHVIQTSPCTDEKVRRITFQSRDNAIGYAVSVVLDEGEVG